MNDNLHIQGDGNIGIQNVGENANVSVMQILVKSFEYNDLLDKINTKQKLFDRTPENETEERLQLSAEINQLKKTFEQFKRDVTALAETFNKLEINTDRLRRAKEFFDQSAIGEARAVLETELEQMQDEQTHLLKQKEHYETEVLPNLINNSEEFYLLAMATQADYNNPNRFEDTYKYFDLSIKSHPTKDNIFQFAYFLHEHNQFNEAEKYYSEYLNYFNSLLSKTEYAIILNNLAVLHSDQNRYEEALIEHEEALLIYRGLAEKIPDTYLPCIAGTLSNLAKLYWKENKHDKSFNTVKEARDILQKLSETNQKVNLPILANVLIGLGILHKIQNQYDEALKEYEEALTIYRNLAKTNPNNYLSYVAMTLNNLAILHYNQKLYDEALQEYEEALTIRRKLAQTNPHTYLPDVAVTLNSLANLHKAQNRYEDALKEYEEALTIRRNLAKTNPHTYLPFVAMTLNNLAIYYQQVNIQREKSLEFVMEAILIVLPIVERVPFTQKIKDTAMAILRNWGLSDEEISQMIAERVKGNK